jgi:hypothetical protein
MMPSAGGLVGALLSVMVGGMCATDTLHFGETLYAPNELVADSGNVKLSPQTDGNLVIYGPGGVLWASNSGNPKGAPHLFLGSVGGNLNYYGCPDCGQVLWSANTTGGQELVMQSDCNLVLRDNSNNAIWASNTICKSPAPGPAPPAPPPPPPLGYKPNIIFHLADDFGHYNSGWAGNEEARTPNIDALVAEGVVMDRQYTFKSCSPTRSSFLSGRLPYHVNQANRAYSAIGGGIRQLIWVPGWLRGPL